jgi:fermentation-respiration switch protein FrsA (DUF1100 family)
VSYVLAGLAAAYAVLLVWVFAFQERMVYHPSRDMDLTPAARGWAFDDIRLTAADGIELNAWVLPVEGARGWVLFCHGNAGNISHRLETLDIFRGLNLSVLIFDYRGYGLSQGRPSEEGTYRDAAAAWQYLTGTRGVDPREVVIWGRSLGGAVAAQLAAGKPCAGLILESSFADIRTLGARLYPYLPIRLISRYRYPTAQNASRALCPIMIIHSPEDDLIAYSHAEDIFEAAPEPKRLLTIRGDHNGGFLLSGEVYTQAVDAFVTDVLGENP